MKTKSDRSSKPLHLIIEGSDKSGKSTICRLLSKKLNMPVVKMKDMPKYFNTNPEEASEVFNKTIVQFKHVPFIMDRGYPSSIVYSAYFRRKADLMYIKDIEKELKPIVIVLVTENPREEDEIVGALDQLMLNKFYRRYAVEFGWYVIEATNLTPQQICKQILGIL